MLRFVQAEVAWSMAGSSHHIEPVVTGLEAVAVGEKFKGRIRRRTVFESRVPSEGFINFRSGKTRLPGRSYQAIKRFLKTVSPVGKEVPVRLVEIHRRRFTGEI